MKLTKEECIKHFDNFSLILFNELDTHQLSGMTDEEQDTLWRKLVDSSECFELLINEHFDNPPLKFEDLKEDMWVWDNHSKTYRRVIEPFRFKGYEEWIEFEDVDELYDKNRFYRREVQDD